MKISKFVIKPNKSPIEFPEDEKVIFIIKQIEKLFFEAGIRNPIEILHTTIIFIFLKYFDDLEIVNDTDNYLSKDKLFFEEYKSLRWENLKGCSRNPDIRYLIQNKVPPFFNDLAHKGYLFAQHIIRENSYRSIGKFPESFRIGELIDLIDSAFSLEGLSNRRFFEYLLNQVSTSGSEFQIKTPSHLTELMVSLIAPSSKDKICDPACGTSAFLVKAGEYIRTKDDDINLDPTKNKIFKTETFYGFDIDTSMLMLGSINLFLNGIEPNIKNSNFIEDFENLDIEQKFSVVLSNPPFGGMISGEHINTKIGNYKTKRTELLFLNNVIEILEPNGRAAVIVPEGLLFGSSQAHIDLRKKLINENYLQGIISLPSGSFLPHTGVRSSILIFEKGRDNFREKIWFYDLQADGFSLDNRRKQLLPYEKLGPNPKYKLTEEEHSQNNLPECLNIWQKRFEFDLDDFSNVKQDCFFVNIKKIIENDYILSINRYGKNAELENQLLQAKINNLKFKPAKIKDLILKVNIGKLNKEIFEDYPNTIYIPKTGKSKVVCSLDELTLKQINYFQLIIDPKKSKAHFLAEFLNSEIGQFEIAKFSQGMGIVKSIRSKDLALINVYLPPIDHQEKIILIDSAINEKEKVILNYRNYLSDLKKKLWTEPNQIEKISKQIKSFSLNSSEESKRKANYSLEEWIDTIPFPLASILRTWQATEKSDYIEKYQHLLHFFEASSLFLSAIYISAFQSDPDYEKHKIKIRENMKKNNLSFHKSTFGTWINVIRYYSKQTRMLIKENNRNIKFSDARDKLVDYFKDSSLVLPSSISQIELTQLLENSCRFRNETKGHGGYIENESAKFLNDELIVMLEKFRSLLTNVWDDISLVKGYKIHLSGKVYTNHFSLLKGSNSEFLKESRDMTMALDQESLYLAYLNQTKALRLEPLLQISASPRSAKNACYFYSSMNKNTAKFVSYHHSEENYIEGNQFKETISTINSLNGD